MALHGSTFEYLKPTDEQLSDMGLLRSNFKWLSEKVDSALPEGDDKDHVLRLIRDAAMWANVSITRHADGSPRN